MLDVGCGVGVFLGLVADRGAATFGLDASETLIAAARRRLPDADLRVGEMEALPYEALESRRLRMSAGREARPRPMKGSPRHRPPSRRGDGSS